ncbi:hypothetical protein, partial [Neisseria bergeri]
SIVAGRVEAERSPVGVCSMMAGSILLKPKKSPPLLLENLSTTSLFASQITLTEELGILTTFKFSFDEKALIGK